jgi:hypothetical protein
MMKRILKQINSLESALRYFDSEGKEISRGNLRGDVSGLTGDVRWLLRGDVSGLTGDVRWLLRGDVSGLLRGDVSGLTGDVSWLLRGDVSGLRGDVDDADLSPEDRQQGVAIQNIVGE